MPTIRIQKTDLAYDVADTITFNEGLIGLPHLRRMVLVHQTDIAPFLWLASLDDERTAFLVLDPRQIFSGYNPLQQIGDEVRSRLGASRSEAMLVLAIVTIAPDWTQSTVNLRAPLFIAAESMRGAQVALTHSNYELTAPLPRAEAA